eukprot:CAMPEP_0119199160 /NCGR_PEP_ID=MMETSP1316-20130426/21774_1 /TAXON_ID=41880 /ORGANISM="Pycnococcus provasolii, Strain RCC2336" /LENGTH=69 /DNA_ID=CAMNT_0007195153 /DNA_START=249 /DNA_END=455 /DNA_ORIENTATION=+
MKSSCSSDLLITSSLGIFATSFAAVPPRNATATALSQGIGPLGLWNHSSGRNEPGQTTSHSIVFSDSQK